jgi:hypothetical protein
MRRIALRGGKGTREDVELGVVRRWFLGRRGRPAPHMTKRFVSGAPAVTSPTLQMPMMLSRQSLRALPRAQWRRWPLNAASRRAESTDTPSHGRDMSTAPSHDTPDAPSRTGGAHEQVLRKRSKRTIVSGIQPTGVPHLGNYLGALRQWVRIQDGQHPNDQKFFSIVDLHAITVPQDPHTLLQRTRETYLSLLAIGLDPVKSTIFVQSNVLYHTQLMWLLSCHASMGYLGRMTQWKVHWTLSKPWGAQR